MARAAVIVCRSRPTLRSPAIRSPIPHPGSSVAILGFSRMLAVRFATDKTRATTLCKAILQDPKVANDPRFATNSARVKNRAELDRRIATTLRPWSRTEAESRLAALDIPFGSLDSVRGLIDHPQLATRDRWRQVESIMRVRLQRCCARCLCGASRTYRRGVVSCRPSMARWSATGSAEVKARQSTFALRSGNPGAIGGWRPGFARCRCR